MSAVKGMTARPYQRAHHRESDESDDDDDEENSSDCRQQRVSRSQRAAQRNMQLHAFLWMAVAGLVAYGTDVIRVLLTDARVKWYHLFISANQGREKYHR